MKRGNVTNSLNILPRLNIGKIKECLKIKERIKQTNTPPLFPPSIPELTTLDFPFGI